MNLEKYLVINEEVKTALDTDRPVVALESTIISHGFNYPENLETARRCEEIVREQGAIPATIGIIDGKIVIGLSDKEIIYFAENRSILKCSRRDVPAIIAKGINGATTVTTTMMFAKMAGIKVFATGGIGGVHFNGENSMDISADLEELARTNVAVVCSGAKSILDIPRTLEYLETNGVTTLGYKTEAFPDFYTQDSGKKVDYKVNTTDEIAEIIQVKDELGITAGVVVANPIPKEYALETNFIRNLIQKIVKETESKGIEGNKVTPFILEALHKESEGKSVVANKELVYNNAHIASLLATSVSKLKQNMKKIMLVCTAGMSTSFLVTNMRKAAKDQGIKVDIFSLSTSEAESTLDTKEIDVLLLGPQVRYMEEKYKEILIPKGIPIDVIDASDYSMMKGENVLKTALELAKD